VGGQFPIPWRLVPLHMMTNYLGNQQENLGSKERLCPAQKQQNTEVSVKTTNWSCVEAIKVHIRKASSQILLLVATMQKQPINKHINQIH
jgi:hypothetical protein